MDRRTVCSIILNLVKCRYIYTKAYRTVKKLIFSRLSNLYIIIYNRFTRECSIYIDNKSSNMNNFCNKSQLFLVCHTVVDTVCFKIKKNRTGTAVQ